MNWSRGVVNEATLVTDVAVDGSSGAGGSTGVEGSTGVADPVVEGTSGVGGSTVKWEGPDSIGVVDEAGGGYISGA